MAGFNSNASNIFGRLLNSAIKGTNKSLKILASAKRELNGAELSVLSDLEAAVKVNTQGARNADNSSLAFNVADSSINQISNIQIRMRELSVQAANGTTGPEEKASLNQEFVALREEANRIRETSEFNGQNVLSGGEEVAQLGNDTLTLAKANITDSLAELDSLDISTEAGALAAIGTIDTFGSNLSSARSIIGANQDRLAFAGNQLKDRAIEEELAASVIRDADLATEITKKTANDIKLQAGIATFAQANVNQSKLLDLLRA
jgi:flagellin